MLSLITRSVTFIKQHRAECICFTLLLLLAAVGFAFHEPSYDEAQAWQIARTASLPDMIWGTIPIHEGHPPFWHLLLALPARSGIGFHAATTFLGMFILLVSGWLIIFKSPFPRWVRCLLPFSFFLFYQYGIVVRPYGVMMVLLWLLAMYFPQKDKRPGLFVGLLAALSACHLFGLAIACGITLAWLWEIKNSRPWKVFLLDLKTDTRFYWMLGLLGWALLIMACISIPRGGAYAHSVAPAIAIFRQIIYVLFALPAETVLTDLDHSFHTTRTLLPWLGLLRTAIIGILLWAITLLYTPRKRWLYLLLPYVCMSLILIGYSSCHHIGMVFVLFVTYFWINLNQGPLLTAGKPRIANKMAKLLLGLCLLLPIGWSVNVLYWDYKLPVYPAKEMVNFLKKYNLTDQTIFLQWLASPTSTPGTYSSNTNSQPAGPLLNIYLDHNIFANFHDGQKKAYIDNFRPSVPDMLKTFEHWRTLDVPTVLINRVHMDLLYNNPKILDEYRAAYTGFEYQLWKLNPPISNPQTIYLFRTLWDKYKDQILADAPLVQKNLLAHTQTAAAK